jgi:arylsulfatase A-like enzyme/Tfp pilus assembly protein PilF
MQQLLAIVWILAVVLCAGCSRGTRQQAAGPRPNVLLVTIDTLRADHVGVYGYAAASTGTLDALAARGVRFETAVAHVPLTGPSHASILTGLNPIRHGFRNNSGYALPATVRTAAEEFRAAGYRTAAFVSAFPLDRRFGLNRGFEVYNDHLPRGNDRRRTPYVERFADATTDVALRWLSQAGTGQPWFLWVHFYDPHAPYEPPAGLGARGGSPYDGEIAFVDRELGRLLQTLSARGESDRTLTLVTADHGESLGEHGEGTHGLFVYDATLRVPWIMTGPGIPAGRVSKTVARSIDIVPTLVDYAGLEARKGLDGRSLRPAADGREMSDAPAYAESLYGELELGWAPLYALRTRQFKLILAPRPELYDLAQDAAETANRYGEDQEHVEQLRRPLQAAIAQPGPSAGVAMAPDEARKLAALGYVSGGSTASPAAATAALRDPKDGIRFMPRLNRGMSTARTEPEAAIRDLSSVLAEDPGLLMARRTRAVAYAAAGQHERAIADLRIVEKAGQLTPDDAVVLGDNLRGAGRLAEAAATLETVVRENPAFAQPLLSLVEVRIQENKFEEAEALCQRVLKLDPDRIEALRRLGDLALGRSDLQAAEAHYTRVLELDGGDVAALTKLGVVKMRTGRAEDAVGLFRRAIDLDPENAEALLYMAGALASRGRAGDALPYFERALKADPSSTMALNGLALTSLSMGDAPRAAAAFRRSLQVDPNQPEIARRLAEIAR